MAATAWSGASGVATPWGTRAVTVAVGTPMGLLLALTYAVAFVSNINVPITNQATWTVAT